VPPRDGNGSSTGAEDELVAKIIPLRRRGSDAHEPRSYEPERESEGLVDSPEEPPLLAERSVWEQPTVELRRRGTPDTDSASRRRSMPRWLVTVPVVAIGLIGMAVVLVIALSTARNQAQSRRRTGAPVSSGLAARSAATTAVNKRASSLSHRVSAEATRNRQSRGSSSLDGQRVTRSSIPSTTGDAGVIAHTTAPSQPAASSSPASGSVAQSVSESAPARPQSSPASRAGAPSTSQSQCVPGELGC
jgi:cytoskeletal protein RodZ